MTNDTLKSEERMVKIPEWMETVPPHMQIHYPKKEESSGSTKEESEQEESAGEVSRDKT